MFDWGIESLSFSGGGDIAVERASMLIIVGPNNSGKSTALRNINELLHNNSSTGTVVTNLSTFIEGEAEDLRRWLKDRFKSRQNRSGYEFYVLAGSLSDSEVDRLFNYLKTWSQPASQPDPQRQLEGAPFLLYQLLTTRDRMSLADSQEPMESIAFGQPTKYIHVLQLDEELNNEISAEVRNAFNMDLIINPDNTKQVAIHIGNTLDKAAFSTNIDYLRYIHGLPMLKSQGDGIVSFAGILLAVKCGKHPILMIDEPEAFLHPKQAERLGGILAESATQLQRQIIVATHSSDIVRGAMAKSDRVAICRVTRQQDRNFAQILPTETLKKSWAKPILKSNATIAGVFYSGVVICEAHGDVEFYESLVRRLEVKDSLKNPADLYFVHGSGNQALATLAQTYRDLGINVGVITDIDTVRERSIFHKVVEAVGASWEELNELYEKAYLILNEQNPVITEDAFYSRIQDALKENIALDEIHTRLGNLIDDSKAWSSIKKFGINAISADGPQKRQLVIEFFQRCKSKGVFIVPVGELENWWVGETVPSRRNKAKWIIAALQEIDLNLDSMPEAETFMLEVCSYLGMD